MLGCSGMQSPMTSVEVDSSTVSQSKGNHEAVDDHRLLVPEEPAWGKIAVWPFRYLDKARPASVQADANWMFGVLETVDTEGPAELATQAAVAALVGDPFQRFHVLERSQIAPVIAEQKLEFSGLADAAALIKAGQLLGADHVVVGACLPGARQGDLTIALRVIEVSASGRIVAAQVGTCEDCGSDQLRALTRELTGRLFQPTSPFEDAGWADEVLPGTKDQL